MPWLRPLSVAYHDVYHRQTSLADGGREWIGSRDYFALVKLLRHELVMQPGRQLTPELLAYALCRNFGGQPRLTRHVLGTFHALCFSAASAHALTEREHERCAQLSERERGDGARDDDDDGPRGDSPFAAVALPPVVELVAANLAADSLTTRHLMLCTRNAAAVGLLRAARLLDDARTDVLFSSQFADDISELTLIRQVNLVKTAMALGRTIVLVNHDNLYEALYGGRGHWGRRVCGHWGRRSCGHWACGH
jgi:hypothetical protein